MKTKNLFFIRATTGCSCCSYENFVRGPFTNANLDEAKATIERWQKGDGNPLASQYSRYGNYRLIEKEGEELPDGRFIVEGVVWGPDVDDKREEIPCL